MGQAIRQARQLRAVTAANREMPQITMTSIEVEAMMTGWLVRCLCVRRGREGEAARVGLVVSQWSRAREEFP